MNTRTLARSPASRSAHESTLYSECNAPRPSQPPRHSLVPPPQQDCAGDGVLFSLALPRRRGTQAKQHVSRLRPPPTLWAINAPTHPPHPTDRPMYNLQAARAAKLERSIRSGDRDAVALLLGEYPSLLRATLGNGQSPLMIAARYGRSGVATISPAIQCTYPSIHPSIHLPIPPPLSTQKATPRSAPGFSPRASR